MFTIMILTSGLNACKSRRGVATQKTDILNSTHWSLRKSLIPKIDNMSKLGYPSQKSQKLRYFERKEVILAFTRDPHATAAMSKWCETETSTSVHCGRSTHTTCLYTMDRRQVKTFLWSIVSIPSKNIATLNDVTSVSFVLICFRPVLPFLVQV